MAAPPQPAQDINFRGMTVLSISLVTFAISANLVFLRMYVRIKRHITGWDDYTICAALVSSGLCFPSAKSSPLLTRKGTFPPGLRD